MKTKEIKIHKNRMQKRAFKTRTKLMKAALDVFCEKSVDAATVEEITSKADVGKGTLYQHFTDKSQMVITLVEDAIEHLIERIKTYENSTNTLEEILTHLFQAHYSFLKDSREEFILLSQGKLLLKLESDRLNELEKPYVSYLEYIQEQISSCICPEINQLKVRQMACAVAGFIFGYFSFALIDMTPEQIDKSLEPLKKVFVKSLTVFAD